MFYKRENSFIADCRNKYYGSESNSFKSNNNYLFWNDWFGRPGNGAPISNTNKNNLTEMLEPSRKKVQKIEHYNKLLGVQVQMYKSNHRNFYEIIPKQ